MGFFSEVFIHPWLLGFLAAVPLLWILMKLLPPPVRKIYFPAAFILQDVSPQETTSARMPLWLFLLRAVALALFVFAFAHPVFDRREMLPGSDGSVILAIDNGWAAAARWNGRMALANDVLTKIAQTRRDVILLPTAPLDNGKPDIRSRMTIDEAKSALSALKPMPWQADHVTAKEVFDDLSADNTISHAVYIGEGVSHGGSEDFLSDMQNRTGLTVVDTSSVNHPLILFRDTDKRKTLTFTIQRLDASYAPNPVIRAYADDGSLLDTRHVAFSGSDKTMSFEWDMPADLAMRAARFKVGDDDMASALYMQLNRSAQQAGILTDGTENPDNSILSEVYYLRRALQEDFAVYFGDAGHLIKKSVPVIIWPDSTVLTQEQKNELLDWVEKGGRLIRFSGANLAAASENDPLLPVPLRREERFMKNGLTGQEPLRIRDINTESPLSGLTVPSDVTVSRQSLALPTPEVFEKTWVSLDDGTPLVTAASKEKGDIILIHTTAGSAGSNLCFSGFYVEMLARMISGFTVDTQEIVNADKIKLQRKMNAFGTLQVVSDKDSAVTIDPSDRFSPSAQTPPGIYGGGASAQIMNLGASLPGMMALTDMPANARKVSFGEEGSLDIKTPMLILALFLFFADALIRMLIVQRHRFAAIAVVAALAMASQPAFAEPTPSDLMAGVYIGHIVTGDTQLDRLAQRGLQGLLDVVRARTTIDMRGVVSVDPQKDDLSFYPVLYWPLNHRQPPMSEAALRALQNYMRQGGLLLIDTRDGGQDSANTESLQQLLSVIAVPALMPVPENHILGRSFYVLKRYPGATDLGDVWVEKEPDPNNDAVTSIIVGGHDWIAAWSFDETDRQRFAITPDGEAQRETAYRFGVNMMMMALAGNYKSDQIHVDEILKRFGK